MTNIDSYNLMTIDPVELLKISSECVYNANGKWQIQYEIRLWKKLHKQIMIASTEEHKDNALFKQIYFLACEKESAKEEDFDKTWNKDSLRKSIIYINFAELFKFPPKKNEDNIKDGKYTEKELKSPSLTMNEKLYFLFKNGIKIFFEDQEQEEEPEPIIFVPFDKSGSMSRTSRITFIDKKIKPKLDRRLLLDIDFTSEKSKLKVVPSKYFAYRGLYLTDGQRIESQGELLWNEKKIIVLPDEHHLYAGREHVVQNHVDHDITDKKKLGVSGKKETLVCQLKGKRSAKEDTAPLPNTELTVRETNHTSTDSKPYWKLSIEEDKVSLNAFDGEGFISPSYARLINEQLNQNRKNSTSFQIRMPFIKGVLHTVDFHGFLEEYFNTKSCKIIDIFGKERDLGEAEIILTESMLKNAGWLKTEFKNSDDDPMEYIFKKFQTYRHTLYIANTDKNLNNSSKRIRLNYQFLNTMDMGKEDFADLIADHLDEISWLKTNKEYQREQLLQKKSIEISESDYNPGDTSDDGEASNLDWEAWQYALAKNISFLKEPKIRNILNDTIESYMDDIFKGRLLTEGECRFLSCDLLALMIHILKICCKYIKDNEKDHEKAENFNKKIEELKKNCIRSGKFYMAAPKIPLDFANHYAVLRNPHLSRNEQCLLKPYIPSRNSIFRKYFGHLSGILMIAYQSLVPMALAGADFDGDLVKIFANRHIVDAIMRGAYNEREIISRKLPLVSIPSGSSIPKPTPESISYQEIKDTFGNQVGKISNMAIRFGKTEYSSTPAQTSEQDTHALEIDMATPYMTTEQDASMIPAASEYHQIHDTKDEGESDISNSAACTLLTGLEIDAAKTGLHPNQNIKELRKKLSTILEERNESSAQDYFIDKKNKLSQMTSVLHSKKAFIREDTTRETIYNPQKPYIIFYGYNKFISINKNSNTDNVPIIDRLPAFYFESKFVEKHSDDQPTTDDTRERRFTFQKGNWRSALSAEAKADATELIQCYTKTMKLMAMRNSQIRKCKNSKWYGKAFTLLDLKYDLKNPDDNSLEKLDNTYKFLENIFIGSQTEEGTAASEEADSGFDFHKLNQCIEKMDVLNWQYAKKEERGTLLATLLELPEEALDADAKELLTDFDCYGYMLLYYTLQDIKCSKIESVEIEDILKDEQKSFKEVIDSIHFKNMKEILKESTLEKETSYVIKTKLLEYCKEQLCKKFKNLSNAVPYVYAQTNGNTIFWDLFEANDIKDYLIWDYRYLLEIKNESLILSIHKYADNALSGAEVFSICFTPGEAEAKTLKLHARPFPVWLHLITKGQIPSWSKEPDIHLIQKVFPDAPETDLDTFVHSYLNGEYRNTKN